MDLTGFAQLAFRGIRFYANYGYNFLCAVRERNNLVRMLTDYNELSFFLEVNNFIREPGTVIYDVGAAVGSFAVAMGKVKSVKKIYAFEPIPSTYQKLSQATSAFPSVECLNYAIGERNEKVEMFVNDFIYASSLLPVSQISKTEFPQTQKGHLEEVAVMRLDDIVQEKQLQKPDFIKVDVQGFEDRVIDGGQNTFVQAKWCLLEMNFQPLYEKSALFDDVYQRMCALGFELYSVTGEVKGRTSGSILAIDGLFRNKRAG